MKLFVTSIFICVIIFSGFSQNREIDSLKQLMIEEEMSINQVDLLNSIAFNFNKIDLDSCYYFASLSLDKAKAINYTLGIARAINLQSGKFLYRKDYDRSIAMNEEALALVNGLDDHKILSQIYNTLAVNYYYMQNEAKSIELLQRSLDESKLAKDSLTAVIIASNIAYMHLENDELELAENYLNESLRIAEKLNYKIGKVIALRSLGSLHAKRGNSSEALAIYEKGLEIAIGDMDHFNAGHLYLLKGKLLNNLELFDMALENLFEAVSKFEIRKEDQTLTDCYFEIADVYNKMNDYNAGLKYADLGFEFAGDNSSFEKRLKYSLLKSNSYEGLNDLPKAYNFQKEYKSWSDSLYYREKQQKVNELEARYQLQQKEVENQLLKEEQARQEAVISEQKTRNYAIFIFSLLASALAFVSYRSFRTNRNYSAQLEEVVEQRTVDLKVTNLDLKRSNEELERFAYIASHDLKEPLRNISTFSQLIKKEIGGMGNEKLENHLAIVDGMTEQMNFLVNGILQYSKISKHEEYDLVDLNDICVQVKEYLKIQISEKDAVIKIQKLPSIKANNAQIFQVFKNLIENGIKYNTCCQPIIDVKYSESKRTHHFSVQDNGIGIEDQYKEQIFEMFNRLHNRSEFKGAGLGLSIVQKIVENMGGEITVESTLGVGSEFKFSIPKD